MPEELNPVVVAEVETKTLALFEEASAIVVTTQRDLEGATTFVRGLKAIRAEIAATFDPVISAAHAAHKAALGAKKKHSKPIDDAERTVKGAIVTYTNEQERLRREQIAAENAEKARLQKAAEEERKRREAAKQFAPVAEPAPPPPPSAPPPPISTTPVVAAPKAVGLSTKTKHVAQVDDLAMLVAAVAQGRAPLALLKCDLVELRKFATATKGTVGVDGVTFSTETIAAVR